MRTIWKYELNLVDTQMIPMGDTMATPLAVAEQDGKIVMWVEHDTSCVVTGDHVICVDIFGTGHNLRTGGNYLGTVLMPNGLVWHIYTKKRTEGGSE